MIPQVKLLGSIFSIADSEEPLEEENPEEIEKTIRGSHISADMAQKLAEYKRESLEFNKAKLMKTIDENMEFHDWMEKHKRIGQTGDSADPDLTLNELVRLGDEPGITHPFACRSSPFFNSTTKETILEVKNPTPDQRPFPDLKVLTLIDLNEKEPT